jgi:hypothetical protein
MNLRSAWTILHSKTLSQRKKKRKTKIGANRATKIENNNKYGGH